MMRPAPVTATPSARPARWAIGAALAVGLAATVTIQARALKSQHEALVAAFGSDATIEKKTAFLTEAQVERARSLAGVDIPSPLVTRYEGTRDGRSLGFAYFDTHLVRTLPETLLVVVDPAGTIARIEVVSFAEPDDYLPKPLWFDQFRGRRLDAELTLKRAVHGVTGATLSSRAATDAARRVLAIDRTLAAPGLPAP